MLHVKTGKSKQTFRFFFQGIPQKGIYLPSVFNIQAKFTAWLPTFPFLYSFSYRWG